jgi:hypothetical protein
LNGSITVYRFDRISSKEWNITEQKILNISSFISSYSCSFYLINEAILSSEELIEKRIEITGKPFVFGIFFVLFFSMLFRDTCLTV